jgi:hypothetical protein
LKKAQLPQLQFALATEGKSSILQKFVVQSPKPRENSP